MRNKVWLKVRTSDIKTGKSKESDMAEHGKFVEHLLVATIEEGNRSW